MEVPVHPGQEAFPGRAAVPGRAAAPGPVRDLHPLGRKDLKYTAKPCFLRPGALFKGLRAFFDSALLITSAHVVECLTAVYC